MDIASYISDLLSEHQEVSLPGIGTFFKKDVSASFSGNIYSPPSKKIDFRSDDAAPSLLIRHIVSVKHISESSALYFVERFCENLKNELNSEETVDIVPLGTLSKAETGYNFIPSISWNSPGFFGLPVVHEAGILTKDQKAVIASDKHTGKNDEVLVEEEEPSKSGSLWVGLFVLLLALGAAGWFFTYNPQFVKTLFAPKNKSSKPKIIAPITKPDTAKTAESFADSIVNELEKQGMKGSQVEKTPDTVTITTKASTLDSVSVASKASKVYEVIIASFGLKSEAERSVKAFKKKGIDAKVVVDKKKPKYKVSIGTFTSNSAAHKENRRIQQELSKDSWVLTINNQ